MFIPFVIAFVILYCALTMGWRVFVLLAIQSVIQTCFYYLGWKLGIWTDIASLALAFLCVRLSLRSSIVTPEKQQTPSWPWIAATTIPALLAFGFVIRGAWLHATDAAIRTPWPLVSPKTIPALALIPLCAWLAAWKSRSRITTASLAGLAIAAVTLIAPLLYTVGYGFDGFLHVASEKIIAETGTLEPKPLYYIGQYVFVTWLSRLTNLPLELVDRFLVPIAAALLPLLLLFQRRERDFHFPSLLLFLPLAPFVATTPQSFAYVCGLAAILCALDEQTQPHPIVPLSFAAWALTIHPLAGLPFAFATLALLFSKKMWAWIFVALAGLSIPLAFLFVSRGAATNIAWDLSKLVDIGTWLQSLTALIPPRNRVALWPDWTAIVLFLTTPLALASACLAAWRDTERRRLWLILILSAVGCVLAGLALRATGDFAFLIDYERGNYANRLFLVALLLIIPAAATGAGRILAKLETAPALSVLAILLGLAGWHGAQAYAALPRHDAATVSRGWSTGKSDIEAVRWIEQDAQGRNYTVLANQSVSAAAVREYGFKRYIGDIFYYPIPTGGPLYQLYLEAVGAEPSLEVIREAARLGQSELVYVVLNDYWWDAKRVGEDLSTIAEKEATSSDGRVRMFRFEVKR